jgi:hypothetical protein
MPEYAVIKGDYLSSHEMCDWGTDPSSGAKIARLTSAPGMSRNIYCEQPYCSPDGHRVLVERTLDMFSPKRQLIVADLRTMNLTLVEPEYYANTIAHSAWAEWVYYLAGDGSYRRVSLLTLERQRVLPPGVWPLPPGTGIESMTPDDRYILADENIEGGRLRTFAYDLETGERIVISEEQDNVNPHIQAERRTDRMWCVRQLVRREPPVRVPVFVQDVRSGKTDQLPVGETWSAESSGHMAWIGTTGRVACAVDWDRKNRRQDPRNPGGNLVIAAPGDTKPEIFPSPGFAYYHVSVSRCGRYFVADECMEFRMDGFGEGAPKPLRIVVGCFATGKSRLLIGDCQSYGIAGSSFYEPVPYFTADNRHVIYIGSPFGTCQVFAARVPEEFLHSLE